MFNKIYFLGPMNNITNEFLTQISSGRLLESDVHDDHSDHDTHEDNELDEESK